MSAWPDIDPQILRLIIDGGEELVRVLWHALSGDKPIEKERLDKIRRRAQEAFLQKLQDELEQEAAAANLAVQLAKLGPPQQHVLDAFDKIDNPTVPKLDLDMEQVTDFDKPEGK